MFDASSSAPLRGLTQRAGPCLPRASIVVLSLCAGLIPLSANAAWVGTASHALPISSSIATQPVASSQPVHVTLGLALHDQAGLQQTLKSLHTPGNPQYGKFLTPAQFTSAYSATAAQAQSVADYLTASGFHNVTVAPNRLIVSADGTAAVAQKAFNTQMVKFSLQGRSVYAAKTDPMVPDALKGTVTSILGLQNAVTMHTHIAGITRGDFRPSTQAAKAAAAKATPNSTPNPTAATLIEAFTPADFRNAYDAGTSPDGSNTVVGITTGGDDLSQVIADLRQAEKDNSLPFVPVEVVQTVPLPDPQDASGDDEWDLDSQSLSGLAGNVKKIIFYNADGLGNITADFNAFVSENRAKAMNVSIGGCESLNVLLGDAATDDAIFMQGVAQGQTFFVSAGDAGAACSVLINLGTPDSGIPSVEYPASSPYVVAVGGTSLFLDADHNYAQEITWTGTGGGTSTFETAPDWQNGIVPTASATLRGVPDISMDAGFNVAVAAFYSAADTVVAGEHSAVIGTSLSSPLAAGAWARYETSHCNMYGFAAPMFYALDTAGGPLSTATGFNDVTVGSNGAYAATPGWDYTTGFGSMDLTLVNAALPAVTCAANKAPTAKLTASDVKDPAPLSVSFNGSQSTDPDGDTLEYYIVDFGDGSPVSFQSTPAFPAHVYQYPGNYTASLTVRDSRGAPSLPVTQLITVTGTPQACVLPGPQLITSPAGVSPGTQGMDIGMGTDDLLSANIAEPPTFPGSKLADPLVFTIKVGNLTTVLPGFRWLMYFQIPEDPTTDYYVAMVSSNGAAPVFNYGTHGTLPGAGLGDFTYLGDLDAASNYTADGTITLVLDKSLLGIKTGDQLTNVLASVRASIPDDTTGTLPTGEGLTQDTAGDPLPYTVVGNDVCAADLAGTPIGGTTTGTTTGSTAGGTTGGGTTGTIGVVTPTSSADSRLGGGGAFGGILAPLFVLALRRRRRAQMR